MKKSTLLFISTFCVLFSVYLVAVVSLQPDLKYILLDIYSDFFRKEVKSEVIPPQTNQAEIENSFDPTELVSYSGRLKKDTYEEHLSAAELKGLKLIQNEYELFQRVFERTLVEASSGKGYRVDSLTHSFPYITPESKKVLEELGLAYEALAGAGNFFTVSSATRTEEQQKALKRRNRNATDGNSSHSYGVSFDISYIRFNGIREWDAKAQKNLETVLNHFQQTGKIYVIKERRQSCYHVTVR
ncbi:DUF5715 family protein [Algoriphagus sp. AK58]|uniref:DUF5715 family protein n=1 Tax=Algoriphagus sp. AK58 TaxID=1406877 RepID=UPI00164FC65B|nr:DUF5715 family protein [Algoriphagus sp. AK58]MBC6369113.1 hypothetical protein [Algoriphagus sp. AK58]